MRNLLWFSVWKNVNKTWEKKLLTHINDIILGGKARGFFNAKLRKATQNLTSLQKCLEVFLRRGKNLTSSLGRLSRRTCLQVFLMFLSIHLRPEFHVNIHKIHQYKKIYQIFWATRENTRKIWPIREWQSGLETNSSILIGQSNVNKLVLFFYLQRRHLKVTFNPTFNIFVRKIGNY